jgi:hypothetical protein
MQVPYMKFHQNLLENLEDTYNNNSFTSKVVLKLIQTELKPKWFTTKLVPVIHRQMGRWMDIMMVRDHINLFWMHQENDLMLLTRSSKDL